MSIDLLTSILAHLSMKGWQPAIGAALASKEYATAVGPKQAHVYLEDWSKKEQCFVLTGTYYSEGRNCLAPLRVTIASDACAKKLKRLVAVFSADADKVISDTYAARLYNCRAA